MPRILTNKIIAITGASSGIGRATACACAAAGMGVVVAARRQERLKELVREIQRDGGRAQAVVCDVNHDEDVGRLIDQTMRTFGRLDAFFANAGYGIYETIERTTLPMFRDIFETNFFATVHCLQAALPALRQTRHAHPACPSSPDGALAHLLICSSALSEISIPMDGAYAATKAAQDSVAGALRAELSAERIEVSTVHPIGTSTEFSDRALGSREAGRFMRAHNRRWRNHTPERVAQAIMKCLHRPRPEVWPSGMARLMLATATACPGVAAYVTRRMMKKLPAKDEDDDRNPPRG